MTGMEHAIEKVARIIHGCTGDEDGAPVAARALAEAGLLAPAPLQEDQAEAWDECSQWHAEQGMPVYGAGNEHNPYRTEGDGKAVTHE